ncbi:CAP domain-containing protein [Rhizoctonia solani]|nr:CAP domain-containing protein [Rhizoctonia solani]
MLFPPALTLSVLTSFLWPNLVGFATANQALVNCEMKCSQMWSFPTPTSSPSYSRTSIPKTKPASTHISTSEYASSLLTSGTREAVSTTIIREVEPTLSYIKDNIAAVASSSLTTLRTYSSTIASTVTSTTTALPTSQPTLEPPNSYPPGVVNAYLESHNSARAAHGAKPLTWSDELATAAQSWANNCVFEHSGGSLGPYGENLAAGSGDYSASSGVEAWVNEASQYNSGNPTPSHFTQVVWKGTSQLGCAVASCNLANFDPQFWPVKFHVCEYSSPGNVIGQFSANVEA